MQVRKRIVRDGPGWGVEVYSERYGWYYLNDEPFASRSEARDFLESDLDEVEDRHEIRTEWARGFRSRPS